jgi:fatty acid desaturase
MDYGIITILKGIILTEALTHAVRSWGILDGLRGKITQRCAFLRKLLACFECTSVWIAAAVICYLLFFELFFITWVIILQRLACYVHVIFDLIDARRAVEQNKI